MKKIALGVITGLSLTFATNLFSQSLVHSVESNPNPWTHERFDAGPNKFTFAIHSDLTGGERPDIFATAMAQLALLRPEFIISVGDLIEGGDVGADQLAFEWDAYDARVQNARAPLFYVGGNHDLSTVLSQQVWKNRLGPSYYHFRYKDVLFLVLNTEDNTPERIYEIAKARAAAVEIYKSDGREAFEASEYANMPERSAGTISVDQSAYFQKAIAENEDVRWTFLFLHKPAWKKEDENQFLAIENTLSDRPYTVFNGHEHVYKHRERFGRDYIQLATTGGEQFPDAGLSEDHVTLITVSDQGVDIANLMLAGIRDKTGKIPNIGETLCFAAARCGTDQ